MSQYNKDPAFVKTNRRRPERPRAVTIVVAVIVSRGRSV